MNEGLHKIIMEEKVFKVLLFCTENELNSQRELADYMGVSLGTANSSVQKCKELGLIDENNSLTKEGKKELNKYKVDNAIIMAAGMSTRFAPISYEMPKGLLKVKGEILIERQIKQLQEVGIDDITVVVGYMAERFLYLKDKFGVKVVLNPDYYRYNNTSTLIKVVKDIKNTYICSSDNYFTENPFNKYEYNAYYSAIMVEGKSDEWGLITDRKGLIKEIDHRPENMYCMMGHAYFDKDFSKKFCKILKEQYELPGIKEALWETVLENNLKELPIYIKKYDSDVIKEFDSLEELRDFDDKYLENTDSKIFKNICKVLDCSESDITNIEVVKEGLTNLSFSFDVKGTKYIYRHPGIGTENYISRVSEAFSTSIAKELGLDKTVITMDGKQGWKISYFIENARTLDYHNYKEVKQALTMMRKLHDGNLKSKFDFDIWENTLDLLKKLDEQSKNFEDFDELLSKMKNLYSLTKKDNVEKRLCHCDCYDPNFLIDKEGSMTLIDWEYSGNDDPGCDLGTFICCSDYTYEEALQVIEWYYGYKPSDEELRHMLAYVSIASYYWFIWAIYQESLGKPVGEYLILWYEYTKIYLEKAMKLYK